MKNALNFILKWNSTSEISVEISKEGRMRLAKDSGYNFGGVIYYNFYKS